MIAFRRKWLLAVLALPMAMMLLLPGVVWGGLWVGVEAGPTYHSNVDVVEGAYWAQEKTYENVKFDVNFLGGLTVGYDFSAEGFLGRAWPSWMKYFSLALDATYEDVSFGHQWVTVAVQGNNNIPFRKVQGITRSCSISMFTITPMIIGKYGFLPSAEIPFGRLQPYVGFGPGVVISNPKVNGLTDEERNKVDLSLMAEGGLRFMLLRNVSLDAALRYRTIPTKFGNSFHSPGNDAKVNIDWYPDLFNAMLRLSYHF